MATPNRSIRLSDEAMEFISGLALVYGSPDKGILAIAKILSPETLAAHAELEGEDAQLTKPESVDSLKGVIQSVEAGVVQHPPTLKVSGRAESVAQRKARETREHAALLAESDTTARAMGREDIEYDLDDVRHRQTGVGVLPRTTERHHYPVTGRTVKPITRPHGHTDSKKRHSEGK